MTSLRDSEDRAMDSKVPTFPEYVKLARVLDSRNSSHTNLQVSKDGSKLYLGAGRSTAKAQVAKVAFGLGDFFGVDLRARFGDTYDQGQAVATANMFVEELAKNNIEGSLKTKGRVVLSDLLKEFDKPEVRKTYNSAVALRLALPEDKEEVANSLARRILNKAGLGRVTGTPIEREIYGALLKRAISDNSNEDMLNEDKVAASMIKNLKDYKSLFNALVGQSSSDIFVAQKFEAMIAGIGTNVQELAKVAYPKSRLEDNEFYVKDRVGAQALALAKLSKEPADAQRDINYAMHGATSIGQPKSLVALASQIAFDRKQEEAEILDRIVNYLDPKSAETDGRGEVLGVFAALQEVSKGLDANGEFLSPKEKFPLREYGGLLVRPKASSVAPSRLIEVLGPFAKGSDNGKNNSPTLRANFDGAEYHFEAYAIAAKRIYDYFMDKSQPIEDTEVVNINFIEENTNLISSDNKRFKEGYIDSSNDSEGVQLQAGKDSSTDPVQAEQETK